MKIAWALLDCAFLNAWTSWQSVPKIACIPSSKEKNGLCRQLYGQQSWLEGLRARSTKYKAINTDHHCSTKIKTKPSEDDLYPAARTPSFAQPTALVSQIDILTGKDEKHPYRKASSAQRPTDKKRQPARKKSVSSKPDDSVTSPPKKKQKKTKASGKGLARDREQKLLAQGFSSVIGADEAGRGPLAGPVVGAACYLPPGPMIEGVMDSKKVSKEEEREKLYEIITSQEGVVFATHAIDSQRIDEINILNAALEAMQISAEKVATALQESSKEVLRPYLLVDGNRLPKNITCNAEAVVKGDSSEYCIAAASILAKVTRDRMMGDYDQKWPMYKFKQHKGYPTNAHMNAIREFGPCTIHRMTFHPLKKKR